MCAYKFLRTAWKKPSKSIRQKTRLWSRQGSIKRAERPTRIDRARALGYRAKQGFVIVRGSIRKGKRRRPTPAKGRKPHSMGLFFTPKQRKQTIVEKRVARKFPNLEVLNSYIVGEDGTHEYYEVILVDPHHPSIASDHRISWIAGTRRRAFRGLTSSARKARGL